MLADGTPFIVMELLSGVSLYARLRRDGSLSIAQTVRLMNQLAAVLTEAHALGIVHRDIKPENIVLVPGEGDEFTAKVLDFGIAKVDMGRRSAALTCAGTTFGTPSYMSPEQLVGAKGVDGRADLWSAAVVAYCCLTGELPFVGDTFGAVCLAIHSGTVIDPSHLRPGLPVALDAWFRKAWTPVLEKRFATAREMANAFSVAAGGAAREASGGKALSNWHARAFSPTARTLPMPKARTPGHARPALVSFAILALITMVFSSWTLGGPVNRPVTERRAADVAQRMGRWTASYTLQWPIVAIGAAGGRPHSAAEYSAGPPTAAILEPTDAAAEPLSDDASTDE
jgi:serine/threonine-protein kinase